MTKHLYDRLSFEARYTFSNWVKACAEARYELFSDCLNSDEMPHIWELAEEKKTPTEEDERRVLDEALAASAARGDNWPLPDMFQDRWCNEVAGLLGRKCKGE